MMPAHDADDGGDAAATAAPSSAPSMSSLPPLAAARAGAAVAIGPDTTGEGRTDTFEQELPASGGLASARSGVPYPTFPDVEDGAEGASLPHPDSLDRAPITREKLRARKRKACLAAAALMAICTAVIVSVTFFAPKGEVPESDAWTSGGGGNDGGSEPAPPSEPKYPTVEDEYDNGRGGDYYDDDASRIKAVRSFILENSLSSASSIESAANPQRRALEWIAVEDPRRIHVPRTEGAYHSEAWEAAVHQFVQRYALAVVYYALGGTTPGTNSVPPSDGGGAPVQVEGWKTNLGFLRGDMECDWYEPMLIMKGTEKSWENVGVICDDERDAGKDWKRVTKLWIPPNHDLKGSLPPEIRLLSHITSISMAFQDIEGDIPEQLCLLPNLEELSLSNNHITGAIPDCMKKMKNLRVLTLDDNLLTGDFVPTVNQMQSLQYLHLGGNSFDATLDHNSLRDLKDLVRLDLSATGLKGVVPRHFFGYPNLQALHLNDNELAGPLPVAIEEQATMEYLDLHRNGLTGDLRAALGNLTALVYLDLSDNGFEGKLSEGGVWKLTELQHLSLGKNNYDPQPFPPFHEELTSLMRLSLYDSNIEGPIPASIGKLTNLVLLDLFSNRLSGTIPSQVGNLGELKYLLLNQNLLTGQVPHQMGALANLELVLLDHNSLNGTLDDTLCPAIGSDAKVSADCGADDPEVTCSQCCQICLEDEDDAYEPGDWVRYDGQDRWKKKYGRYLFAFEDVSV